MKTPTLVLVLLGCLAGVSGCASSSGGAPSSISTAVPLPAGVTLTRHQHLQSVWVADGYRFTGQDPLVIATPAFKAVERPNEVNERAVALRTLQETLVASIRDSGAFPQVVTQASELPAGSRFATLETTVVEYEKGGGGARYWAGLYGAGQPVIKVRGHLLDPAGKPLFVFEARRSGESGGARVFGAFRSDVEIQSEDIRDLGIDLRDFLVQQRGTR